MLFSTKVLEEVSVTKGAEWALEIINVFIILSKYIADPKNQE